MERMKTGGWLSVWMLATMAAVLMFCPNAAASQTSGGAPLGQPNASAEPSAPDDLGSGPKILSDTMGVDFGPYLKSMMRDIHRNWQPLIPEKVKAPEMKKGVVGIRFTILPNGKIGSMKLETRSGDVDLDKAAWYAITSEGQFPPLPKEFHGPKLELRVGFFYNTPIH